VVITGKLPVGDEASYVVGQGAPQMLSPTGQPQTGPLAFLPQKTPTTSGKSSSQSASVVQSPQSSRLMPAMGAPQRVSPAVVWTQKHVLSALHKTALPEAQLSAPDGQVPCPATQVEVSGSPQSSSASQQTVPHVRSAGQQASSMQLAAAQQEPPHST
jgi:hypothetical protein